MRRTTPRGGVRGGRGRGGLVAPAGAVRSMRQKLAPVRPRAALLPSSAATGIIPSESLLPSPQPGANAPLLPSTPSPEPSMDAPKVVNISAEQVQKMQERPTVMRPNNVMSSREQRPRRPQNVNRPAPRPSTMNAGEPHQPSEVKTTSLVGNPEPASSPVNRQSSRPTNSGFKPRAPRPNIYPQAAYFQTSRPLSIRLLPNETTSPLASGGSIVTGPGVRSPAPRGRGRMQ